MRATASGVFSAKDPRFLDILEMEEGGEEEEKQFPIALLQGFFSFSLSLSLWNERERERAGRD